MSTSRFSSFLFTEPCLKTLFLLPLLWHVHRHTELCAVGLGHLGGCTMGWRTAGITGMRRKEEHFPYRRKESSRGKGIASGP